MSIDYDKELPNKYVYLPKVGEEATFDIVEIRKVTTGLDRFHFQAKVEDEVYKKDPETGELMPHKETTMKSMGWHIECSLADDKTLTVTSLGAFIQVFKKNEVKDGNTIYVKHIDRGEWKVAVSGREPPSSDPSQVEAALPTEEALLEEGQTNAAI